MFNEARFFCPYCGEENILDIDILAGNNQEFFHDCELCCRPVEITVMLDPDGNVSVDVRDDEGF